jgi:hypothetical protein
MPEAILEPELPIVDPPHHCGPAQLRRTRRGARSTVHDRHRPAKRYLLDELMADTGSGHNVIGTCSWSAGPSTRPDGRVEMRLFGRQRPEFVNGVRPAMSAQAALYGADMRRPAPASSAGADLLLGDGVKAVLEAISRRAAGGSAGHPQSASFEEERRSWAARTASRAGLYLRDDFRRGSSTWRRWASASTPGCWSRSCPTSSTWPAPSPDTTIVLDHVGTPLGRGGYTGKLAERFPIWKANIRSLRSRRT